MAVILPNGRNYFATTTGPGVGYRLYAFVPGTSTPKATYTTSAGSAGASNTHPVVADARGEMQIYWEGAYDVVLRDAADALIWGPERLEQAATDADFAALVSDLADTASVSKNAGMVGYNGNLVYPDGTIGWKARQFRTFKDFGAVGDGVVDDTAAIALALASDADVYDDTAEGGTYRITSQIDIPNSCFTRFHGAGNIPVQKSKFFVDFDGAAFKGAVGTTSFLCFHNFYCYGLSANTNAQFIDHDGDCVHSQFTRLTLRNFRKIAIDLTTFFRGYMDVLIQYCWDYGVRVSAGSASHIKFTADYSYAGGADIGGGGHTIEPYTEMICSDNDPAGANASWRELILRGGPHTVRGGVLSLHPQNNKYPISLITARAITFIGVSPYSLGAASYWINFDSADSSAVVIDCPGLTGGGTSTNLMTLDAGYTSSTKPEITIAGQSIRNTTPRVWALINGSTGALTAGQGPAVASSRTGTGQYRVTWTSGTFASTNYGVQVTTDSPNVASTRWTGKTSSQVDININNASSGAAMDAYEVFVEITGV